MDIAYEKTVVENDKPDIYYDGDSMGGGFISFPCGACGEVISKETFYFWKENKDREKVLIEKMGVHFNLPEKDKFSDTFVGLLECSRCSEVHALHIDYGEVSNGHWQCGLHKVVLCNS